MYYLKYHLKTMKQPLETHRNVHAQQPRVGGELCELLERRTVTLHSCGFALDARPSSVCISLCFCMRYHCGFHIDFLVVLLWSPLRECARFPFDLALDFRSEFAYVILMWNSFLFCNKSSWDCALEFIQTCSRLPCDAAPSSNLVFYLDPRVRPFQLPLWLPFRFHSGVALVLLVVLN